MDQEKIDREMADLQRRARAWIDAPPPSFPLWLWFKCIWLILRGKHIAQIQLHPPYQITLKEPNA